MWLSIVGLLYAAQLAAAACNHNNCLRAVIASAFPTRSGSADCSSYFKTTVETGPIPTKTVIPTSIPRYASACSGSVGYSSACSCVGATAATITVPATISSYPFLACYTDSPTRLLNGLPSPGYIARTPMSNEICAAYCQSNNFLYFGTEYSDQCFCGNALEDQSVNKPAPAASCSTTCAGTPTETCGGTWFIDVWGPD